LERGFDSDSANDLITLYLCEYAGDFELSKSLFGDVADTGLKVESPARHYGMAAALSKPVDPSAKTFVFQYEVMMQVQPTLR